MKKAVAFILILLLFLFISNFLCCSEEVFAVEDTNIVEDQGDSSMDDDSGWFASIKEAFNSAAEAFSSLLDIFSNVGIFVKDFFFMVIAYTIGLLLDVFLYPFWGSFSQGFLSSQTISSTPWVVDIWRLVWWPSLIMFSLAILFLAKRYIEGKQPVSNDSIVLVGATFIINFFSLWITEYVILKLNYASTSVLEPHVNAVATLLGESNVGPPYSTNLVLKGLLGGRFENGVLNNSASSFSQYLLQGDYTKTIPMVLIMLALICLALFILMRWVVIRYLQISSPVYLFKIALDGQIETGVGFANIYFRTCMVQIIFTMIWIMSYQINTKVIVAGPDEFGGISPDLLTAIILWAGVYVIYKFWFVQTYQAVRHIATLNGGKVINAYGYMAEKAGNMAMNIADNFGRADISERARSFHKHGQKAVDYGKELGFRAEKMPREYQDYQKTFAEENPLSRLGGNIIGTNSMKKTELGKEYKAEEVSLDYFGYKIAQKYQQGIVVPKELEKHFIKFSDYVSEPEKIQIQYSADGRAVFMAENKEELDNAYRVFLNNLYWKHKDDKYVVIKEGFPVVYTTPPTDGTCMGKWRGSHRV